MLGVVYAVLLGFVTIAVWEDFEAAKVTTHNEANELAELFWLAQELPEPDREQLQELTYSYAKVVVDEEWSLLEQGQASPRAEMFAAEMRASIYDLESGTDAERVLYDEGLDLVRDLVDQRRLRLLEAGERIPDILWDVLLVGGIIVVGFTYLFGLENTCSQTLMIASLTAVISLVHFTIYALDRPVTGITQVEGDAFELVLNTIDRNLER